MGLRGFFEEMRWESTNAARPDEGARMNTKGSGKWLVISGKGWRFESSKLKVAGFSERQCGRGNVFFCRLNVFGAGSVFPLFGWTGVDSGW